MTSIAKEAVNKILSGADVSLHVDPITGNVNLSDETVFNAGILRPLVDMELLDGGDGSFTSDIPNHLIEEIASAKAKSFPNSRDIAEFFRKG